MPLAFRLAAPADVPAIVALADRIWRVAYAGMLPPGQVDYMLRWMYAPSKLEAEIAAGFRYELAFDLDVPVGYLALEFPARGRVAFLHKLYLAPELHGRGVGQELLRRAEQLAREFGAEVLELRVNKGNARALKAYTRFGFTVAEAVCASIGGGFVMDDFVLRKPLGPRFETLPETQPGAAPPATPAPAANSPLRP